MLVYLVVDHVVLVLNEDAVIEGLIGPLHNVVATDFKSVVEGVVTVRSHHMLLPFVFGLAFQ